jgi:hypothetical protein
MKLKPRWQKNKFFIFFWGKKRREMEYFLGQEDRNMKNGMFGIGDYIFINGTFLIVKDYIPNSCTIITGNDEKIVLTNEPSFPLFMDTLGESWDLFYKSQWKGDEDYTDYVPMYYPTLEAFTNRGQISSGIWYHK